MSQAVLRDILIVDDEPLICEMVRSKLLRMALPGVGDVRTADSGEAALALCASYRPHLVLTDIRMGGMDGIELIARLSKALPGSRFIVLSGYDDFELVRRAFTSGAFDYLLKPVVTGALMRVVEAALQDLAPDGATGRAEGAGGMALTDQIRQFIDQHFARGITLAQVAVHFGISYSHMSKLFKTQFQMLFSDYLTEVRMQKAAQLLGATQLNVQEVAAQCGYDNVFHFSRAFKKHTGVAPSHYRHKDR